MDNDTKPWYASKTVWGGIVATAAPLVALGLHVSITGADQQQIIDLLTSTGVLVSGIGSIVGGVVAVYGRIKATSTIAPKGQGGPSPS